MTSGIGQRARASRAVAWRALASWRGANWTFLAAACILMAAADARAQSAAGAGPRSTGQGVYTRDQWIRGRDVYAGMCTACHPAVTHTGPIFNALWAGKQLSDLFGFVKERMPKNDPGSLSEEEYVDVITYILRLNGMPAGVEELPVDSLALSRIRIDSSRVGPPSTPPGR